MARVVFNEQQAPLVFIEWPADYSPSDLEQFLVQMRTLVRSKERVAVVNNLLHTRAPTPLERKRITDAVDECREDFRLHVVAWSDVLASTLIRGVITAIRWVNPAVYPHKVHADIAAAEGWCRERLRATEPAPISR